LFYATSYDAATLIRADADIFAFDADAAAVTFFSPFSLIYDVAAAFAMLIFAADDYFRHYHVFAPFRYFFFFFIFFFAFATMLRYGTPDVVMPYTVGFAVIPRR